MNEDLCRLIEDAISERVNGEVHVELGMRYIKLLEEKRPVYIVNILYDDIHWHRWYEVDDIYDHFNDGKTVDDLVSSIVWKYKGFLIHKCVTKKFFKETA